MRGLDGSKLFVHLQHIGPANHLVYCTEAKFGHVTTEFLGEVIEEVDDLLWLTREFGAKLGILSSDTDRAGIY
jgi:hypothetical protein